MKIELRRWAISDSKKLVALCNAVDRSFLSDRLPNPYTIKDAEDWLRRVSQNEAVSGTYRAIIADGSVIGSISVERKEDVFRIDGDIGFMLLDEYWNKDIATEVVGQLCRIAFSELSLERITANVFQPNIASMHVLKKNGFVHEGTLKKAIIKNGILYDLCIFGLTKNCRNPINKTK